MVSVHQELTETLGKGSQLAGGPAGSGQAASKVGVLSLGHVAPRSQQGTGRSLQL